MPAQNLFERQGMPLVRLYTEAVIIRFSFRMLRRRHHCNSMNYFALCSAITARSRVKSLTSLGKNFPGTFPCSVASSMEPANSSNADGK